MIRALLTRWRRHQERREWNRIVDQLARQDSRVRHPSRPRSLP